MASRFISSPLSIITVRLQTEREGGDDELREAEDDEGEKVNDGIAEDKGVYGTAKSIYAEEGLAGFWKGQYSLSDWRPLKIDR